ncbi:hypothetical protein FQN49_003020 [Arthroderma sp. PD_2]|nr:hypothetical protein FQN49_003020 [Arthroderma sp. PD_2]
MNYFLILAGKTISHEDVYRYTNGHFLVDEEHQYAKRYARFNIDQLCDLVSSVAGEGASRVCKIDKTEGSFHKALLMTLQNGTEVVAKIPCPHAGMSTYSTASEVAVMEFVRTNTIIPVPKVLAWSSNPQNTLGTEYIIMEMAKGVQLYTSWGDLSQSGRLEIIKSLVFMEKQLSSLRFPAYGNLYFRHCLPESLSVPLDKEIDPSGLYCVGPAADNAWLDGETGNEHDSPEYDPGPWMNLQAFGEAFAKRSLYQGFPSKPRLSACHPQNYGSPSSHKSVLERAMKVLPLVSNHPTLVANSTPTLLHTDLHMGNIFVTEDGPIEVTSIIDWHSISIGPKFMQARWPVFLQPQEGYPPGLVHPKPPSGLEQMDTETRARAIFTHEQNYLAKAYEACTACHDIHSNTALGVPRALKEIYIRCGETSVDGIFPLKSCLVDLYQHWLEVGFTKPCPISFTEDELSHYNEELSRYEDWYTMKEMVKRALDTDSEGWISPAFDFEEKLSQNRELYELYIKKLSTENKNTEEAKALWPFPIKE